MTNSLRDYMVQSAEAIQATASHVSAEMMDKAVDICVTALKANKPILVCGNGGSAADAMHIAAELVARFLRERKGLNCICLSSDAAMMTSWANDYGYETVFARQIESYGCEGAVLIGISTSGTSKNVLAACAKAKEMGLKIIGLTGQGGAKMADYCDALLDAPSTYTPIIQQIHVCLYHYLCEKVEAQMAA
ncbi:MAG: SIS domain-containing protein [Alphaproteobacteria bacterium]|nr:SIS domain-containing protein [Alphaproteobacteria bacterium]